MSDDFVRQFPAGVVPVHRPKSLEENLRQDDLEFEARKRADPKLVPALYDDINDAMTEQHQAAPTDIPDAHERERIVREEREFLAAFERGLAERLVQVQMAVTRCVQDGTGEGWRIHVRDSAGRPFDVALSYDEAIKQGQKRGRKMGDALMTIVVTKLLAARRRYFERMGVELS